MKKALRISILSGLFETSLMISWPAPCCEHDREHGLGRSHRTCCLHVPWHHQSVYVCRRRPRPDTSRSEQQAVFPFPCFLISCCASGAELCGDCFSSAAASGCWNDSIPFDSRPVQQKQPTPLPRAIQGARGNLSAFQCLLFLSRGRLVA